MYLNEIQNVNDPISQHLILSYRLASKEIDIGNNWAPLAHNEQEFEIQIKFIAGCPDSLIAHFAASTHCLGHCTYAWLKGSIVVVNDKKNKKRIRVTFNDSNFYNSAKFL